MSQHLHTWSVSGTVKFSTWPFSFHSVLSCMLGTCTLTATGPWRGKRQNDSRLINLREWNEHRCYRPNFTAKSTYITKEVGFLMEKYLYCKNIHRTFHGSKKNLISTKELLLWNKVVLCLHLLVDWLILMRWGWVWVGWWCRSRARGLWYWRSRDKCCKKKQLFHFDVERGNEGSATKLAQYNKFL